MLANLERIQKTLEEESGRVASMSCWAEAAGVSEKVLQQSLCFGWYCRDQLLRSTRSLVLFLARNYRGLGIHMSDLLQVLNFCFLTPSLSHISYGMISKLIFCEVFAVSFSVLIDPSA